ncbi:unnamed protein product [Vicia faba]|uniref:Uncharacterized protein n=1 Tax=Vicia faba TaxID=3906 RepID=A0AAV0ZA54_VICFA|nr:unnamed protein product [Vicia faba]
MISSLPDINPSIQTTTSKGSTSIDKTKVKQEFKPLRKMSSERIKENWFKKSKSFTGPGSNLEQPMYLTEEERNASQTSKKATKSVTKKSTKGTPKKATKSSPKKVPRSSPKKHPKKKSIYDL